MKRVFWGWRGHFCLSTGTVSTKAVCNSKSFLTWSDANTNRLCWPLFRVVLADAGEDLAIVLWSKNGLRVLWFLDKWTLLCDALAILDNALRIAINEEMASNSVDCALLFSATTGIPKALFVETEELDLNPLCTTLTPDLWKNHGFPHCVCTFIVNGLVHLDVNSCPCNLCGEVAWNTRSRRFASFFASPLLMYTVADRCIQTFYKNIVEHLLLVHISTVKSPCHQFFSILGWHHTWRLCKVRLPGFCFCNEPVERNFLNKRLASFE